MNVRVESMCRGDGKIYIHVAIDRVSPQAIVFLEARLKNGTVIPSHLYSFDPTAASQDNYAVILPHFNEREIVLEFSEYRGPNSPMVRAYLTIETGTLALRTRINAVVNNEPVARLFDIEREYASTRMNVHLLSAIDDGGEIVVKVLVNYPLVEGFESCAEELEEGSLAAIEQDVEVRFLDAHGKDIDLPVYPLFDEVIVAARYGDANQVNVGFSVRVPKNDKDFCISATDAFDLMPGGFAMFCDETYTELKRTFEEQSTDAACDPSYDEWYLHHSATLAELANQRRLTFSQEPLISLVLPLSKGSERYLPRTLRALAAQTYNVFEVIVVDSYFEDREFNSFMRDFHNAAPLTRVKVDESLSPDAVFEAGIAQAQGSYCGYLPPEVVLAPEALFEVARRINEIDAHKPAMVIYAHHDTIHENGSLSGLACKPIYSPDLLYSYNYLGPFLVFNFDGLKRVQKDQGFEAQAFLYDLLLKMLEQSNSLERIDQILYHVQAPGQLSAEEDKLRIEAGEEDFRGGRSALACHLKRIGVEATVLSDIHYGVYRCSYMLPEAQPSVLVVLVDCEQPDLLESCLENLFSRNTYENMIVRVVDDGSVLAETQECYGRLEGSYPQLKIVRPQERKTYAAYVNEVVEQTECDYVLLLDPCSEIITDEFVSRMVGLCAREDVGVVGAKLLFADDTIAQAGITVGSRKGACGIGINLPRTAEGYLKRLCCANNVSAVSSVCQLFKRSVYVEVQGYDARFSSNLAAVDFCLKAIRSGYFVVYDPQVELYHFENETHEEHLPDDVRIRNEQERAYLNFKWPRAFIDGDPFSSKLLAPGNGYYQLCP